MRLLLLVVLFLLTACAAPLSFPIESGYVRDEVRQSPNNSYAIVIKGQIFQAPFQAKFIQTAKDLVGSPVQDDFVNKDVEEFKKLASSKKFDVYVLDMAEKTPETLWAILASIKKLTNQDSRLIIAYSGEGNKDGLLARSARIGDGRLLTTSDSVITYKDLLQSLQQIEGKHALLINACESGAAADLAPNYKFNGVIISACAKGYATTPYEPDGTSALYSSFLRQYQDDPTTIKNLALLPLNEAGGSWNNFRHKWVDFWNSSGLPISYKIITYSTNEFLF